MACLFRFMKKNTLSSFFPPPKKKNSDVIMTGKRQESIRHKGAKKGRKFVSGTEMNNNITVAKDKFSIITRWKDFGIFPFPYPW